MKKKALLFVCLVISVISVSAQTNAVTSNGDEVVLYSDGTWKYVDKTDSVSAKIDTNRVAFIKDKSANFLVKSSITNVGVNINPKKWGFKKSTSNEDAEYTFELKGYDAYGMIITERIEVPLETLKSVALENAQRVATDMKIIHEEYRNVNGITVLCMQMNGTTRGVKFTYFGYYYSSAAGSVQFVTYTSQNLFKTYKNDLEELLNGFVIL